MIRIRAPGRAHLAVVATVFFSPMIFGAESAADGSDASPREFAAGHGTIAIEYARLLDHGDYQGPAGKDTGQVSFQTVNLEASYFPADRWEVRLGIPFSRGKSAFLQQHPDLSCAASPSCQPTHVDNGDYHGTWADWDVGASYHAVAGESYYLTPSLDIYVPSHNYAYYGAAVAGQRVVKYGLGISLQHQLDFSNFYYSAHYQYVVKPRTLGIDSNYSEFGFDVGYFITPRLGIRALIDFKIGHGYTDDQIFAACCSSSVFAEHDRFRLQNHAVGGAAVDYSVNDRYAVSATLLHSFWGQSNAILAYGAYLKLTRSF
jgi:hypothetical protein